MRVARRSFSSCSCCSRSRILAAEVLRICVAGEDSDERKTAAGEDSDERKTAAGEDSDERKTAAGEDSDERKR